MSFTLTVEFSPGTGPFDTPSWVDISDRVLDAVWTVGTTQDLADFPPGEATLRLRNDDRLFDPDYTAGTYFGELLPRVPFRIRATHEATMYDLFYGFVEDGWEQIYDAPSGSTCVVRLVDLLAVLEGSTLPSVLEAEILADDPVAYWPMDERTGKEMLDHSGNGIDGRYRQDDATSRTARVTTTAGVTYELIDFDGTLDLASVELTQNTRPMVVEALVSLADLPDGTSGRYAIVASGDGSSTWFHLVAFDGAGSTPHGLSAYLSSTGQVAVVASVSPAAPVWVSARVPAVGDPELYVDGVLVSAASGTVPAGVSLPAGTFIGSQKGSSDLPWTGPIGHVVVYDSDIGTTRIAAHAAAALAPLDGLRSDEQIQWILDQVGVPSSMVNLDQGRTICGPLDSKGRDALALIRAITATEQGAFYVDHHDGGKLRFRERYHSWLSTRGTVSQATISDDPSTVAARVEPGTLRSEGNGVRSIINRATVTWAGGEVTVSDATSEAAYGPRGRTIDTSAATPGQASAVAQWVVATNAQPTTRITGFGLNPGADPTAWDPAIGLRIGDRLTFRHDPQNSGEPITRALEVLGVTHRVHTGLSWETDFYVTQAPDTAVSLFVLGTSKLDSTDILGY